MQGSNGAGLVEALGGEPMKRAFIDGALWHAGGQEFEPPWLYRIKPSL